MTLIERLEQATKPSRELDAEIARELNLPAPDRQWPDPYTFSIDAALRLVPNRAGWILSRHENSTDAWAEVGDSDGQYRGATPALALTIAALKAREAVGEKR